MTESQQNIGVYHIFQLGGCVGPPIVGEPHFLNVIVKPVHDGGTSPLDYGHVLSLGEAEYLVVEFSPEP